MPISVPTSSTPNCPFLPLWVCEYLMQKHAGACTTHIHGVYEAVQSEKNYVPYLHTLELSNLRIIVMKDVASISAKLVSILIKQTLFKSHTTSKSKCERFQFVEFKCSITNQMMIKVKHACWIDIIIAYSLQLYNRNENLQKRCI